MLVFWGATVFLIFWWKQKSTSSNWVPKSESWQKGNGEKYGSYFHVFPKKLGFKKGTPPEINMFHLKGTLSKGKCFFPINVFRYVCSLKGINKNPTPLVSRSAKTLNWDTGSGRHVEADSRRHGSSAWRVWGLRLFFGWRRLGHLCTPEIPLILAPLKPNCWIYTSRKSWYNCLQSGKLQPKANGVDWVEMWI